MENQNSSAQFKTALATLLATRSLDQITVQDLVRQAGVNRSTFYRHFLNFADFLTWLENDMLTEIPKQVELDDSGSLDFTEFYQYAANHRVVLKAFLKSQKLPDLVTKLREIVAQKYNHLLLARASSIPPLIQAEFLIGGHIGLISWWLQQENPPQAQTMATYHRQLSQPR